MNICPNALTNYMKKQYLFWQIFISLIALLVNFATPPVIGAQLHFDGPSLCRSIGPGATMAARRPFRLPVPADQKSRLIAYVCNTPYYCLLYRVKYTRKRRISQGNRTWSPAVDRNISYCLNVNLLKKTLTG